jgi:hypothetical protein
VIPEGGEVHQDAVLRESRNPIADRFLRVGRSVVYRQPYPFRNLLYFKRERRNILANVLRRPGTSG